MKDYKDLADKSWLKAPERSVRAAQRICTGLAFIGAALAGVIAAVLLLLILHA